MLQNYQIIDTFAYEKDLKNNPDQSLILQMIKTAKKKKVNFLDMIMHVLSGHQVSRILHQCSLSHIIPVSK